MRLITRYIIREITVPFAFGLAIFTLVLLIARILRLVELVVNRGVPFADVVRVFSYILPAFLEVTVPMALLLAVLVALGRLTSDSEIIALKAAGMSFVQIAKPVAFFACVIFFLALFTSLHAKPWGNRLLRSGLYEIAKQRAAAGIKSRIFNDDFAGLVIYVDEVEAPGNHLRGILISDTRGEAADRTKEGRGAKSTVLARVGFLATDESKKSLTLQLQDGSVHSFDRSDRSYHRTDFSRYEITLDLDAALASSARERDPSEMSLMELRDPVAANQVIRDIELQRRFSIPFACLAFAAVGLPLGLHSSSSVRSRGFILSLALILSYYLALTLGQSLAERELIAPLPAVWLPNGLLLGAAAILIWRLASEPARDTSVRLLRWPRQLTARLWRHQRAGY